MPHVCSVCINLNFFIRYKIENTHYHDLQVKILLLETMHYQYLYFFNNNF
jgi:hypothetical protein